MKARDSTVHADVRAKVWNLQRDAAKRTQIASDECGRLILLIL